MRGKFLLNILEEFGEFAGANKRQEDANYRRIPPDPRMMPLPKYSCTGVRNMALSPEELQKFKKARHIKVLERNRKVYEILYKKEKRRRQKTIYKLIQDGFIEEKYGRSSLTEKGKEKLIRLRKSIFRQLFFNEDYKKIKKVKTMIFSFDIPEKHRAVRDLVRNMLKFLGYKMIHQSVWCGNTKLPEEFIKFLHDLDSDQYIKIFSIDEMGNLNTETPKQ